MDTYDSGEDDEDDDNDDENEGSDPTASQRGRLGSASCAFDETDETIGRRKRKLCMRDSTSVTLVVDDDDDDQVRNVNGDDDDGGYDRDRDDRGNMTGSFYHGRNRPYSGSYDNLYEESTIV